MQYTCTPTPKDRALFKKTLLPLVTDAKKIPFRLTVGSRTLKGFGRLPVIERYEIIDSGVVKRTFAATMKKEKLQITAECLEYRDFPVVEWFVTVKNVGKSNSLPLSDFLAAADMKLHAPKALLHHNNGDIWPPEAYRDGFSTTVTPLGETPLTFSPYDGRPCDSAFPYYRIETPAFGYNLAVGWGGEWQTSFSAKKNDAFVSAGQKTFAAYLKPGESVRSPRMVAQCYTGNTERGVNAWRRFYIAHVLPKWDGEDMKPTLSMLSSERGEEFTLANRDQQLHEIERLHEFGVDYDFWWIDAGWYNCYVKEVNRKVWTRTADWDADKEKWPNEFKEVAEKVHSYGSKLLIWFEPERMCRWHMPGVMPENYAWYRTRKDENGKEYVDETALFKMGDAEARKWMTDKYNAFIKRNHIDIYRQDFNMGPLCWWEENDEEGRKGIVENHHVQGYYDFWDGLLKENPGLYIDSCASGGRRNEYETMKRSVPFHYTDLAYGDHPVKESFTDHMFRWIPYFRNHAMNWDYEDGKYHFGESTEGLKKMDNSDSYAYHTAFAPSIQCMLADDHMEFTEEQAKACKREHDLWRKAAEFTLSGDYYLLRESDRTTDSWCVMQFHNEKEDAGVINAVRNIDSKEESITVFPRQTNEQATYVFDCPETNETFEISGRELAKKGLVIALPKRSGRYFFYHKKAAE